MRSFIIHSVTSDNIDTFWIVNAKSKKEAKQLVIENEDFDQDEDILSCDEFENNKKGVAFLMALSL